VRRIFGLDHDLVGFYRVAKADPALASLVEPLYGLRPTLAPTPFEMLVGSITAQQINLSFAFACRARLVQRYGTRVRVGRETVWAFRYSSEGRSRSLFYSTKLHTLRQLYPDNPVLHDLAEETRLVVSEPLGDLAGAWNEVPESSYGVVHHGHDELHPFRPRSMPAAVG